MMCGRAKELMAAALLTNGMSEGPEEDPQLKVHLSTCSECAAEMAQLSMLWERLGDIPVPEPSAALTARWESSLASIISARRGTSWRFSLNALWPQRPVWQVSIAAACLVVGLTVGSTWNRDRGEMAGLREDLANTKQMVALSLLQQQSATDRLRGVDYTVKMPAIEPDVISALVQAVNRDPNVNVRLAAIDALTRVSGDAGVRRSLTSSLKAQDSPMVQAALIDYVSEARDKDALGVLKDLTSRQDLNPLVRQRADIAVQRLTEYK
jgi:hypothetical protein